MTAMLSLDDPRYVKAMAHPVRVRILAMLQERVLSAAQLAPQLGAPVGRIAYHVRTLRNLGLIELVEERKVRGGVARFYRAKERAVVSDDVWAQAAPIAKQVLVSSTLQIIEAYRAAAAGGFDRREAHLTRTPLDLDDQGWEELSRLLDEFEEAAFELGQRTRERLHRRGHHPEPAPRAMLVTMLFEAGSLVQPALEEPARCPAKGREPAAGGGREAAEER
jgi:DNA-binding transcriptional ArsR family regulator